MSIVNSNNFLHKTVDGVKQFFSPLVNAATVVLKDGTRLEKDGKIHADTTDDSKRLGGQLPSYYATTEAAKLTKVAEQSETVDFLDLTGNVWNTLASYDFSVPSDGLYILQYQCTLSGWNGGFVTMSLLKNNAEFNDGKRLTFPLSDAGNLTSGIATAIVECTAGTVSLGIRVYPSKEATYRISKIGLYRLGGAE